MSDPATAIFGSYNARSVDPRVVAERFVAPPQFWDVAAEGNSVLTGPRGSGKTTLLKMLVAPALERWDSPEATRARELVTYSGVFVPADRSWSGQVASVAETLDPGLRTAVGLASFCLHLLRGLSATAGDRVRSSNSTVVHDRVVLEPGNEESIARAVWRAWGLSGPVGTFVGLRYALSDSLAELGRLARRAKRDDRALADLAGHPALDLDPVEAITPFVDRFNDAVGQPNHVWMFLVDEIEFLPPVIRGDLLRQMRGRDPRIMQKVSLAPYTAVSSEDDPLGGWVGHDYQRVDLTFGDKEDGYPFNEALVQAELARRGLDLTPEEFFGGEGYFENPPGADAYRTGSDNAEHIANLAKKDESFAAWLARHQIDPSSPWTVGGLRRSKTLSKAIPIVLIRDEFLHEVRGQLSGRSRKNPRVYLGAKSMYAICEGNPRLLKAIVHRLASAAESGELDDSTRATEVNNAAFDYELHLRALTLPDILPDELLPRRLIAQIGEHFRDGVLGQHFDPEPALSIEVKEGDLERPGLREVLGQLVHYGALVPIGEGRFRLTHMFAPIFRLPLRKGRTHTLSTVLGTKRLGRSNPGQLEIGNEQELA